MLLQFKDYVKKHLRENNSIEFNSTIRGELEKRLVRKARTITEGSVYTDEEMEVVTRIQVAARGFGSDSGSYVDGIIELHLRNKQAAFDFADYLDSDDDVYDYELRATYNDRLKGYSTEVDIDDIDDDGNYTFTFDIELNPDITGVIDETEYDNYTVDLFPYDDGSFDMGAQVDNMEWKDWMGESYHLDEKISRHLGAGGKVIKRLEHGKNQKVVNGKLATKTGADKMASRLASKKMQRLAASKSSSEKHRSAMKASKTRKKGAKMGLYR